MALLDSATRRILESALRHAKPIVTKASEQLGDELEHEVIAPGRARLHLPHFWALYLHDGTKRKRVRQRGDLFVWFRNPADDPRLVQGGKHPVRLSDVKTLTRAQFLDGLRRNAERAARGQPPFMIVTEFKAPRRGFFFFSKGMRRLASQGADVHRGAKLSLREELAALGLLGNQSRSITV